MTIGLLGDILLRQVPERFIAGVSSGELRVYGSVIRSLVTGRIVGHLQETSALTSVAGTLLTAPASLPLQTGGVVLDALGHSISYAQNEQIKAALAVVQNLQVTSLALSTAAIGVSVAGFAVLAAKLNLVEAKVDAVASTLTTLGKTIEAIRLDRVADDFVRLRTALEQLEEGWLLSDPASQWQRVASEAHFLANQFQRRAVDLLEPGPGQLLLAEPFIDALSLAANARVTARMALNDAAAASHAGAESLAAMTSVGEHINLGREALAKLDGEAVPGSPEWQHTLDTADAAVRPSVESARAREAAAAAACLTIAELQRQNISPRQWLETARDEREAPILFLPAS